jgi:hypothetical protein
MNPAIPGNIFPGHLVPSISVARTESKHPARERQGGISNVVSFSESDSNCESGHHD